MTTITLPPDIEGPLARKKVKKMDPVAVVLKVALVVVVLLLASGFIAYRAGAPMFEWLRPSKNDDAFFEKQPAQGHLPAKW